MQLLKNSLITGLICLIYLLANPSEAHYMWLNVDDYTPHEDKTAMFTVDIPGSTVLSALH